MSTPKSERQARWYARHRDEWNKYQRERYRRLHPRKTKPIPPSVQQEYARIDRRVAKLTIRQLEEDAARLYQLS